MTRFDDHPGWDDLDHEIAAAASLVHSDPQAALAATIHLANALPDARLCQLGVNVVEALIDMHWPVIGQQFDAAAREHANLRKALSCASLDIDPHDERRLMALIAPHEDIGRTSGEDRPPKATWTPLYHAPIRDVRLDRLKEVNAASLEAGLPVVLDDAQVASVADPDAGHLIWARFRCEPPDAGGPGFYRCAVWFHVPYQARSEAVGELDVLEADLDALPLTRERRIVALFKHAAYAMPFIDDLPPPRDPHRAPR